MSDETKIYQINKSANIKIGDGWFIISSDSVVGHGGKFHIGGSTNIVNDVVWLRKVFSTRGAGFWVPVSKRSLCQPQELIMAIRIWLYSVTLDRTTPIWFVSDGNVFYCLGCDLWSTRSYICDLALNEKLITDLGVIEILRDKFAEFWGTYESDRNL